MIGLGLTYTVLLWVIDLYISYLYIRVHFIFLYIPSRRFHSSGTASVKVNFRRLKKKKQIWVLGSAATSTRVGFFRVKLEGEGVFLDLERRESIGLSVQNSGPDKYFSYQNQQFQ